MADESAIVAARNGGLLYVLDPATGAERWHLANPVGRCLMLHGVIYTVADLMGDASDLRAQSPGTPAPIFNSRQYAVGHALVALNERDGSLLWQVRVDVDLGATNLEAAAITDRTLYLSGLSPSGSAPNTIPETYAFDAHSGRRLTASSHTAPGTVGSTIYASGDLVAATDQFVLVYDYWTDPLHPRTWALSASDGKLLWDVPGDVLNINDARDILRISGDFMYTDVINVPGAAYSGVTAVRVSDGSVAWTWGTLYSPYCPITGLRVIGGSVFVTVAPPCYSKLTSLNAATGALNWQHTMADALYIAVPASDVMTTMDAGAP
jgi:outer membrane protein assembly factor BamB